MTRYDPTAWYWLVLDHPGTDLWSSAAAAYVPETDASYAAFLLAGNRPTAIDSEDSLRTVLAPVYPAGMPLTPRMTADVEVASRIALGIVTTSTGTPAASGTYPLDDAGVAVSGSMARDIAAGLGLANGGTTAPYADISGIPRDLAEPQLSALYRAQRDLRANLQAQGIVMAEGGTPAWPAQTATIP